MIPSLRVESCKISGNNASLFPRRPRTHLGSPEHFKCFLRVKMPARRWPTSFAIFGYGPVVCIRSFRLDLTRHALLYVKDVLGGLIRNTQQIDP